MRKEREVFVCDDRGNLKHKFKVDFTLWAILSISNKNEILVPSINYLAVHIYSEEGNLKSPINLPEGHEIRGVAFHFAFSKIIVLISTEKKYPCFLLCYTEEGELETTAFFSKNEICCNTSHPSGSFAVVTEKNITFI